MAEFVSDLFENNPQPKPSKKKYEQPSGLIKLSPSSLNLSLDCPRFFWLYINKNIKRPSIPVATITTGLDRIIKEYFDSYRMKNTLPPILKGKLPGKPIAQLPRRGWLDYLNQKENAKLGGYLDECLDLGNNFYAALDHKTRGSAPSAVHRSYQLQMDVYTFLLEKNKLPTKRTAYLVYYLPQKVNSEDKFVFEALVKELKTDPERANNVFHQALAILKGPAPKINDSCNYCSWISTQDIK